jgi:L-rhamnonate dehydratase
MARNEELVRVLRETVGPEIDIMIDAWSSWDVPYTLRMAERFADYAPHWIEEPVLADKIDSYAEITARMPNRILVAGGEHEYTRWGLGKLMAARAMHVFQPDTYWAGGISEMLKIATLASTHDVTLIPHGHSVPANAHLSFALPVSLVPMLEYLVKWNTLRQYLLADPVHPVNGVVHPPQQPGLGMELDEDKIEGRTELRP